MFEDKGPCKYHAVKKGGEGSKKIQKLATISHRVKGGGVHKFLAARFMNKIYHSSSGVHILVIGEILGPTKKGNKVEIK